MTDEIIEETTLADPSVRNAREAVHATNTLPFCPFLPWLWGDLLGDISKRMSARALNASSA